MARLAVGVAAVLVSVGVPAAAAERAAPRPVGQVVTVAGIGVAGYSGDGHRATDARIGEAGGLAVGPDGTLYLADHWSGRVRSVDADGIIDTVPGTRALRSPETDGPDVNGWQYSPSDRPSALTVTSDGTFYIVGDDTVRRLAPDGTSTHLATINETFFYASDIAVDDSGKVYVGGSDQVVRIDPAGTKTPLAGGGALAPVEADGEPATEARLSGYDIRIAVDSKGAVYVVAPAEAPAVPSLHRIDPDGTMHTVAGGREAGFAGDGGPAAEALLSERLGGLAVDQDDNVYLHDQGNSVVRVIDPDGGITSLAPPVPSGGGRATAMAVGPDGDLYLRDGALVRHVQRDAVVEEPARTPDYPSPYADDEPGTVHVVAGSGEEESAVIPPPVEATRPVRIAAGPDGSRYYSDTDRHRVMKVAADGTTSVFAGNGKPEYGGDGGPATGAAVNLPAGLDVGPDGSVYIADAGNDRLRKVDPTGVITTVAGNGVAGDPGGTFGEDVTVHGDGGPATEATVTPSDVAVAPDGGLYLAEDDNKRISRVAPDGTISTVAGAGDRWQDDADGHPAIEADFFKPLAIALGPEGRIYLLDDGVEFIRPAVRMVDPAGVLRTVAGSSYRNEREAGFGGDGGPADAAQLNNPRDLAVGPDGVLYVADAHNARIRAVAPDGTITTFAGTGERADDGDDGAATAAAVNEPQAVTVDADGAVAVIGTPGDRIREIEDGTITTTATIGGIGGEDPAGARTALETPVVARSIAVDRDGGLLFSEQFGEPSKVDRDGRLTHPFDRPELVDVQAMALAPDGTRYVAAGNVVYRVGEETAVLVAGGGPRRKEDGVGAHQDARLASFEPVIDLAVSPGGRLYVATDLNVFRLEDDGTAESVYSGEATVDGIAVDGEERLYVAVAAANQVYSVSAEGEQATVAAETPVETPQDVAVDGDGDLYVGSYEGIHRIESGGTTVKVADNPWVDDSRSAIADLVFDRHGNLYYVDNTTGQVKVVVRPGELSGPFDWAAAIWIAVAVLALGAGGWYFLRWRRRGTVADGASADGASAGGASADEPSADGVSADGTSAVGVSADEPSADGTSADGVSAVGTSADGASADGTSAVGVSADEPSADGTSAVGTSADGVSAVGTSADGVSAGGASAGGASADGASAGGASAVGTSADGVGADEPSADESPERATVVPAADGSTGEGPTDEPVATKPAEGSVEPEAGGAAGEQTAPPRDK